MMESLKVNDSDQDIQKAVEESLIETKNATPVKNKK